MRPDMQPASWCAGTFIFLHESYVFLHELRNGVKANGMLQAGGCGIRIHLIRISGSSILGWKPIRIQGFEFDDQKFENNLQLKKKLIFLVSKITIKLSLRLHKERPSYRKGL